jgi:cell division protease FtsH
LKNNRGALDQLASTLLEKEVIFKEDLERIFGKRKWDKEEISETKAVDVTTEPEIATTTPSTEA